MRLLKYTVLYLHRLRKQVAGYTTVQCLFFLVAMLAVTITQALAEQYTATGGRTAEFLHLMKGFSAFTVLSVMVLALLWNKRFLYQQIKPYALMKIVGYTVESLRIFLLLTATVMNTAALLAALLLCLPTIHILIEPVLSSSGMQRTLITGASQILPALFIGLLITIVQITL
jgi:hypothetical protein